MKILSEITSSAASIGKALLLSGIPSKAGKPKKERLIIMGNGPSLRDTMRDHRDQLLTHSTLAVNFAANTPEFKLLRPKMYVLADPHFFNSSESGASGDPNVANLWKNIAACDWDMALYVPCGANLPAEVKENPDIEVKRYNLTPVEGARGICHAMYSLGLGMPRPRNVLIPSIMLALREGYRNIAIVGADHTWSRDLWVDDENHVISVQKHFYKDNEKEMGRVKEEYKGYHLHDILNSLTIAFRSYHQIASYAGRLDAKIVNCTPGSFIDAFPREKL